MKVVVLSGGTATNSLVALFPQIFSQVTYVLPISDNGGSTSEIIRVIGGPGIGDCRSRVVRLIPDELPASNFRALFSYRLPDCPVDAKREWLDIVDGTHAKWQGIESQYKEMFRAFFIQVHSELLKRSRPRKEFNFERASVGNLFLSGARLFCGSLDSAVELMCKLTMVPHNTCVVPAINTTFSYHISAELNDGTIITGQSQISHPAPDSYLLHYDQKQNSSTSSTTTNNIPQSILGRRFGHNEQKTYAASEPNTPLHLDTRTGKEPTRDYMSVTSPNSPVLHEDASLPFSHPDLVLSQLKFSKYEQSPLKSPIRRIYYVNPYGQEIHPRGSERLVKSLNQADVVIYSIGSLYTSTIPIVLVEGFGSSIMGCPRKIMMLNGNQDRETAGMNAYDHVAAVIDACLYSMTEPVITRTALQGGATQTTAATKRSATNVDNTHEKGLPRIHNTPVPWTNFVTDVIYLSGGQLHVEKARFASKGIRCHAVNGDNGNYYNPVHLQQVISTIVSTASS